MMLNMNETNQGNNPNAFASGLVKHKRGRPRKYPRADFDHGGSVYVPRDPNLRRRETSLVAPGFGVNGNWHHQAAPSNNTVDTMIGQIVHGVVEAVFDAGYLLTVRVGNSETTLRGVVFRPGCFVPISPDNDVAPGVPMVRRTDVPLPTRNYDQMHAHPQGVDRNGTPYVVLAANPEASRGKHASSVVMHTASSGLSGGHVVPVIFQPLNASNGSSSQQMPIASQMVASKGKELLNGATPANQCQAVGNQMLHFQSQNNHQVMPSGLPGGTFPFNPNPAAALHGAQAGLMGLPTMPFETLLTEVMKRVQVPVQSMETSSSSADKQSAKDSAADEDGEGSDSERALSVEPLQAVQPGFPNHPVVVSRPLESYGTGKMTGLLQVLQENVAQNRATRAEGQAAGSSRN